LNQTAPTQAALVIRTAADPAGMGATVQQVVSRLDPNVPVSDVQTMRHRLSRHLAYPQFRARMLTGFAIVALLLAVVGLYAVLSQLVAQRTQEIGIRMALGASRAAVLTLVVKEGMLLAICGVGFGLLAAAWLTRFIGAMLYGVVPADPMTLAPVSVALMLAALVATYLPARRAAWIDPIVALRSE
jgi:ABC-type antimicrobial peptide transport system permease subunit